MADENPDQAPPVKKEGIKNKMMPYFIIGGLMLGEGVAVFFLANAISPKPVQTLAKDGMDDENGENGEDGLAEVELADCRPSNKMAGRFITFHIRVSALVSKDDFDMMKALARAKRARIEDGVNAVIRSAEPKHFNEARYETIKRRLKHEFGRIFGDDQLIKEVLIPQMLQSGPGV